MYVMLCTVHINKFTKFKHESLVSRPTVKAKVTTYTYELLKTYFLCLLKNSNFGFVFVTQLRIVLEMTCFYKEKGTIFELESNLSKIRDEKSCSCSQLWYESPQGTCCYKELFHYSQIELSNEKKSFIFVQFLSFQNQKYI